MKLVMHFTVQMIGRFELFSQDRSDNLFLLGKGTMHRAPTVFHVDEMIICINLQLVKLATRLTRL